jgi:RNA polymerase sigma-70 factor (ECF subfamily)
MLDNKRIIEIYRLYNKELFVYIFRMVNSQETAEDILHDCFENLIKYSNTHDIEDLNIRAFIYKTAHNLSINFIKRRKRIDFISLDKDGTGREDSIGRDIEFEELNRLVYILLESKEIDEAARSIFILRKEQDMDYLEISRILKISERTVRRKMAKVMEFLQNSLKNFGF